METISDDTTIENIKVRRLTPLEAWRLMGFTDEDFRKAQKAMNDNIYSGKDKSGSQLYKQAGNSIVVNVLQAIFRELYTAMPYLFEDIEIGSFFSGIGAFEKALSTFDKNLPDKIERSDANSENGLTQIGYINDYNGDANRIYDGKICRTLKSIAGGGGAKTGWYAV